MIEAANEALEWIDTPFKWGQSVKGRGCDCKGLIAGVARELGRSEGDSVYARLANYRADRPVPSDTMMEAMAALFDRTEAMEPGDVLVMNHAGRPSHMAIFVGNGRAVHAYPGIGAKVRSRQLAVLFHKFPLHSIWRWRVECR